MLTTPPRAKLLDLLNTGRDDSLCSLRSVGNRFFIDLEVAIAASIFSIYFACYR
jgi:hypothetical protein